MQFSGQYSFLRHNHATQTITEITELQIITVGEPRNDLLPKNTKHVISLCTQTKHSSLLKPIKIPKTKLPYALKIQSEPMKIEASII